MLAASLIIKTTSGLMIKPYDYDKSSFIKITLDEKYDEWREYRLGKFTTGQYVTYNKRSHIKTFVHCQGFYEGSIFYGSRFDDYSIIDKFMSLPDFNELLVDADKYVSESLGYILHNDRTFYKGLKKNKEQVCR